MVSEDEWSVLKKMFSIDKEICITRNRGGFLFSGYSLPNSATGDNENTMQHELLSSEPKVCLECVERRRYY